MIWMICFMGLLVFITLIKSDIRLSQIFRGNFKVNQHAYKNLKFNFNLHYQLLMFGLLCIVLIVVSLLFYLPIRHMLLLLGFVGVSYPVITLWQLLYRFHANDFEQITSFLQHFLAHFKSDNKVLLALVECREYVEEEMGDLLECAIKELEISGDAEKAFEIISSKYPHFIVYNIQTWITSAELYGVDDCKEAIELLEDDIDDWIEDTHLYIMSLNQMKNKIVTLSALSLIIALFNQMMLKTFMDLSQADVYHNVIFIFLLIILFTIMMGYRFLKDSWISKGECLWKKAS